MEGIIQSKYNPNLTEVTFPSGETIAYPYPTDVSVFLSSLAQEGKTLVGVRVDGKVQNFHFVIPGHCAKVEPIFIDTSDGRSIYKRTLSYIFMMAASIELKESKVVTIEHAISHGYLVWADMGESNFTDDEVSRIKDRMIKIIDADLPIIPTKMSRDEALSYFSMRKRLYTTEWIRSTNENTVNVHTCCGYSDLAVRVLQATTGQFKIFDLKNVPEYNGMVILFSAPSDYTKVSPYQENKTICDVYREWNAVGQIQGIGCVGQLNNSILKGNARKLIALSESLQTKKMAELANNINSHKDRVKLILIAGPSSSGKTTFAAKLSLQLEIFGFKPLVLSVDNYYKAHTDCPRDKDGNLDFEVIDALRIDKLNEDLVNLMEGREATTPVFDFKQGAPKAEVVMKLHKRGVILMEGIHCLNEKLTPLVRRENKFHIFIAPFSQLNIDETNFLSNTVNRLARRVVRDYRTRGYSALDTIMRWPSVVHAEEHFIFPFMKVADVVFNTALDYELTVLKDHAMPLLQSVKPDMPMYNMVMELMRLLSFFHTSQDHSVPPDSLLREFIGGSFFGAI